MSKRTFSFLAFAAFILNATGVRASDSFTVSRWDLGTAIIDSFDTEGIASESVMNPFVAEHHVTLESNPLSQAHSYFDFSWTPDTASFLIAASHAAFDGNGGTRSASIGSIYITPSVDLLLTATGTYDYDLPGNIMLVSNGLDVYANGTQILAAGQFTNTFLSGPTSGVFNWQGQVVLPAGSEIQLLYGFFLDAIGTTGLLATGSGDIHFTLAPVPEPASLALLALGAGTMLRRRRRPRSA